MLMFGSAVSHCVFISGLADLDPLGESCGCGLFGLPTLDVSSPPYRGPVCHLSYIHACFDRCHDLYIPHVECFALTWPWPSWLCPWFTLGCGPRWGGRSMMSSSRISSSWICVLASFDHRCLVWALTTSSSCEWPWPWAWTLGAEKMTTGVNWIILKFTHF